MSRGTRWILNSSRYLTYWTLHSLSTLLFTLRSPSNNPILAEVLKNAFDYRLQTCSETVLFHPFFTPYISLSFFFFFKPHYFFLFSRNQDSKWKSIQACKCITSHSKPHIKPSVLDFYCYVTVKWPRFAIIVFSFFFFFSSFLATLQNGRRPKWQRSVKQFQRGAQESATRGF